MLNITNYLNDSELLKILDKYNVFDISTHCRKVSSCALRLFDSLNPNNEFKIEERNLLYYSAILHDIGYFINKENHHKHTKYIILKEPLLDNLPSVLRENLALIASGHGKYIDDCIQYYPYKDKIIILKLISLLRIADSLDHKHNLHVTLENVEMKKSILNIQIRGTASNIILKKFKKRSSLFSKVYNIPIYIDCS